MEVIEKWITRTRVEGLLILMLAIGYVWEARGIPSSVHTPGIPGPKVFPFMLGFVFGLSGLWMIISPEKRKTWKKKGEAGEEEQGASPPSTVSLLKKIGGEWRLSTMWIALLGYLVLMPSVGFPVSSAFLVGALFFLWGDTRWYVGIGFALAVTIVIYFCFAKGLEVRLPLGILAPLVK